MLMVGASRTWKFVKSVLLTEYDVDPGGPAGISLRFFITSVELRAVDRSDFRPLSPRPAARGPHSLSHNLRRHRSPNHHPARGTVERAARGIVSGSLSSST